MTRPIIIAIAGIFFFNLSAHTQSVAINNDGAAADASAALDIKSTAKGILVPRMTQAERDAILTPANGLLIYQTNNTPGFYFYNGSSWVSIIATSSGWNTSGNGGTNPPTDFFGTTDDKPIYFRLFNTNAGRWDHVKANYLIGLNAGSALSTGTTNVGIGMNVLTNTNSGNGNTAIGHRAMNSNTSGAINTGVGQDVLYSNTGGISNAALGYRAQYSNSTGSHNVAIGYQSFYSNTTGDYNTSVGNEALYSGSTSKYNTAVGSSALYKTTTGQNNVALGNAALYNNTTASLSVAVGDSALYNNTSGNGNTAVGGGALFSNTTGNGNTGLGYKGLNKNVTGSYNLALGHLALSQMTGGQDNVAVGSTALTSLTSGNYNVAVGSGSLQSNSGASYNTAVGNKALENGLSSYNTAVGAYSMNSTVTGFSNTAIGLNSLQTNVSGDENIAVGERSLYSTVGNNNTGVGFRSLYTNGTGSDNTAIGHYADVGSSTLTNATAIGSGAIVYKSNGMVFGNSSVNNWGFAVSPTNGHALEVGTNITNGNGAYLSTTGNWVNTSDKFKKEDFVALDGKELLDKIMRLPVTRWKYKGSNEYHIGPMAQDFYQLFGLGSDNITISTIDPSGIALAAIQELKKENDELRNICKDLQEQITKLVNK
ncbi:MAG: tail fiber domain-containing protein [Chitinophagaceae bacterium]|nr:tail fiber domain-containing protein [Chitinophagaceae bacterium]MCB9054258.1 tail fiber domain-containing protein [Chitinophagales bacterium]